MDAAALLLAACCAAASKLYRYDPPAPAGVGEPRRISGWLLLVALGVVVGPARVAMNLWQVLPAYGLDRWFALTAPGGAEYHPMWAPALLWELTANLALLVGGLLVMVLFFQRRSSVPRLYIGLLVLSVASQVIDIALQAAVPDLSADGSVAKQLTRSVLGLLLWGAYFRRSVRVRETFVRRLAPARTAGASQGPQLDVVI